MHRASAEVRSRGLGWHKPLQAELRRLYPQRGRAHLAVHRVRREARELQRREEVRVLAQQQQPVESRAAPPLVRCDHAVADELLLERDRHRLLDARVRVVEEAHRRPRAVGEGGGGRRRDEETTDLPARLASLLRYGGPQLCVREAAVARVAVDVPSGREERRCHRLILKVGEQRRGRLALLHGRANDVLEHSVEQKAGAVAEYQHGKLAPHAATVVAARGYAVGARCALDARHVAKPFAKWVCRCCDQRLATRAARTVRCRRILRFEPT